MGGDDDGGGCGAGYLDEVSPDGLSQQGIHPHCGLVQNEKLRLLEQSNREAGSPGNISNILSPCYCYQHLINSLLLFIQHLKSY